MITTQSNPHQQAAAELNLSAAHQSLEIARLTIELQQMRKAAVIMARHVLATTPAEGMQALTEVRRTANAVMSANGPQEST